MSIPNRLASSSDVVSTDRQLPWYQRCRDRRRREEGELVSPSLLPRRQDARGDGKLLATAEELRLQLGLGLVSLVSLDLLLGKVPEGLGVRLRARRA